MTWDQGNRQKSPFNKKSPEIKSSQLETLFSMTFFLAPVWFYTKKSSEKSPLTSENAWFTILGFSFPRIYFLQDFFSWDIISWDFIGSPHTILGKKVPGIQNTGLYFQWLFSKDLIKFGLFSRFFSRNFFPGTFLHRFYENIF